MDPVSSLCALNLSTANFVLYANNCFLLAVLRLKGGAITDGTGTPGKLFVDFKMNEIEETASKCLLVRDISRHLNI